MSEPNPTPPEAPEADPTGGESTGASAESEELVQDVAFPEFEEDAAAAEPAKINRLLDVRLTLSVELGRRHLLLQDVLSLGQGSILDLEKSSSELVDILVNGKLLARGEVVVIDESFGVRITSLVDPVERVKRMGI